MGTNLSLLSIQAAEELQTFSLKKENDLTSAKKLSKLIKKEFQTSFNYSSIFSGSYLVTYNKKISVLPDKNSKKYMIEISSKLESPSNLNERELEQLVVFCVNLSDYSALHEEEMKNIKTGPCF